MNTLDKYVHIYELLHNRKGLNPIILSPVRKIIRTIANRRIQSFFQKNKITFSEKHCDIIVSLTSFPTRISSVHLVIQCLLRQTVLPNKIFLWLSKNQFEGISLPENLTSLVNDIFNIRFVDGDIRSHKKYYYVFSEYSDSRILLVDDDLFYPTDMIEQMLKVSKVYPNTIICRFGSIMKYKNGRLLPYNDWWYEVTSESDDQNLFFGTGGGTLLKKDWLYKDVLNIDLARELTPLADDVWINAMANLKGTLKHKIHCGLILQVQIENNEKLSSVNVSEEKNTAQINALSNYYNHYGLMPFIEK